MSLGCVNAAGTFSQKWYATVGAKSTKPDQCLLAEPCILHRWQNEPESEVGYIWKYLEVGYTISWELPVLAKAVGNRAAGQVNQLNSHVYLTSLSGSFCHLQGVPRLLIQLWSGIFFAHFDRTQYPFNYLIFTWGDFVWNMKHHGTFNGSQDTDGNSFW